MGDSQQMLTYALRYAERGLRVFPLHSAVEHDGRISCSCGDSECRNVAKHPRFERGLLEHGVQEATTDAERIRAWWARWPAANIGMALADLAAIDTDPRNGGDITLQTLIEEHGPLPDTVLAMTGGGGTHHVFKQPPGATLPGKLGKGVDLKHGAHSYIVVEPSRHASGVYYAWEASSDPLDGMAFAPLPSWIGQAAPAKPAAGAPALRSVGFIPPQQLLELRSALAFISPEERDDWLAVGMALHSTSAENAYGIWAEWSQQSEKFDAKDQRRVWNSFGGKANQRNLTTIFAMATERGWVNPASKQAAAFDEATEAAIADANRQSRIELVTDNPAPTDLPIPVPVLEAIGDWINKRASVYHPAVTRQAVLALAALGASRVYVGEGGTPCHLCLGIVAESSVLSAYARDAIARIIDDSGLRRMMRGTRINAASQVYGTLWRSPAAIHVITDYGHLAQFSRRQPSGVLDQAFSTMAEAYTSSAIYIDSGADAGLKVGATDDQLVVHSPALTTLLLSTHAQMGTLLQRGEITRGLMAYQLPIIAEADGAIERDTPSTEQTPDWIREALRGVRRLPITHGDLSQAEIFGAQPGLRPHQVKVRFAADWIEYQQAISALSEDLDHRALVLAGVQTAKRLAITLGAWANPQSPVATREILSWATAYVIRHLRTWLEQYSTLGNESGESDAAQKVLAVILGRKSAGMPRSQVHMYCRAFKSIRDAEKRSKLLDGLIEDGDLIEWTPPNKRVKVLVAKKFARRVDLKVAS